MFDLIQGPHFPLFHVLVAWSNGRKQDLAGKQVSRMDGATVVSIVGMKSVSRLHKNPKRHTISENSLNPSNTSRASGGVTLTQTIRCISWSQLFGNKGAVCVVLIEQYPSYDIIDCIVSTDNRKKSNMGPVKGNCSFKNLLMCLASRVPYVCRKYCWVGWKEWCKGNLPHSTLEFYCHAVRRDSFWDLSCWCGLFVRSCTLSTLSAPAMNLCSC